MYKTPPHFSNSKLRNQHFKHIKLQSSLIAVWSFFSAAPVGEAFVRCLCTKWKIFQACTCRRDSLGGGDRLLLWRVPVHTHTFPPTCFVLAVSVMMRCMGEKKAHAEQGRSVRAHKGAHLCKNIVGSVVRFFPSAYFRV